MKKFFIGLAARLFPHYFIEKAYHFLTVPTQHRMRPHESLVLDNAQKSTFRYQNKEIVLYRWGNGRSKVLMVHGWEGHAGNFADIVESLMAKGEDYTLWAFDGPSHGASEKGPTSSFAFIGLVEQLVEKLSPDHLINHSFGSVATLLALGKNPKMKIERYIGITVPNTFRERLEDIAQMLGLPALIVTGLVRKIETLQNIKVDDIAVAKAAPKTGIQKALLLHDKNDRVLPASKTKTVAKNWPVATYKEVTKTGHYKILRSPKVLEIIRQFLDESSKKEST